MTENNSKLGYMKQALTDIQTIADSKDMFYLTSPSQKNGDHGVLKTKGNDGKEKINIEGTGISLYLHESRHIGQGYEAGGLRFNKKGQLLNAGVTKDKQDYKKGRALEVEAYRVGFSYDTNSYPVSASSLSDVNETTLMQIGGGSTYEALQDPKKK